MMTLGELKKQFAGHYVELEVYVPVSKGEHYPNCFHTDNCRSAEMCSVAVTDDTEVGLYELMDEDDYNHTLLANGGETADFADWYGDKGAKVLCAMVKG